LPLATKRWSGCTFLQSSAASADEDSDVDSDGSSSMMCKCPSSMDPMDEGILVEPAPEMDAVAMWD